MHSDVFYDNEDEKEQDNKSSCQLASTHQLLPYLYDDIEGVDSFNDSRRILIDAISLDGQSRLSLTKKIKKILPLESGDKIAVYQDKHNKNIILKVQRQGQQQEKKEMGIWILIIKKGNNVFSNNKKELTIIQTAKKVIHNHYLICL